MPGPFSTQCSKPKFLPSEPWSLLSVQTEWFPLAWQPRTHWDVSNKETKVGDVTWHQEVFCTFFVILVYSVLVMFYEMERKQHPGRTSGERSLELQEKPWAPVVPDCWRSCECFWNRVSLHTSVSSSLLVTYSQHMSLPSNEVIRSWREKTLLSRACVLPNTFHRSIVLKCVYLVNRKWLLRRRAGTTQGFHPKASCSMQLLYLEHMLTWNLCLWRGWPNLQWGEP